MAKIDCRLTENFLREWDRMCGIQPCGDCPLVEVGGCGTDRLVENLKKAIRIVQEWSDAHPIKTIMDDLLEKYPNAQINDKGIPPICAQYLGYGPCVEYGVGCCTRCWSRLLEDVRHAQQDN